MAGTRNPQLKHRLLAGATVTVIVIAGYFAVAAALSRDDVSSAFSALRVEGWLMLLALSLLNYGLRFLRWHAYLRYLGRRIAPRLSLAIYLSGFALTVSPGKAGEAIRGLYLKANGVPYSETFAALFVERLLDLLAVAVLAALLLPALGEHWWLVSVAALGVLALAWSVTNRATPRMLEARGASVGGRLGRGMEHLAYLLRSAARLLRPQLFYPGLVVGLVAWGAEGFGLYLLLHWLDLDVSIPEGVGTYAVGMLAGAISFLPGGLGGAEAALAVLIVSLGGSVAVAFVATIVCRVATLWFAVAIGVGAILALEAVRAKGAEWP